jgi:hypothetical protein
MHRPLLPTLAALLVTACAAVAQPASPSPSPTPPGGATFPIWTAELPGGRVAIALRSIIGVTKHEYTVDGAARVTEVNVATTSTLLTRFYYIETLLNQTPRGIGQSAINTVVERLENVADRAGVDAVWKRVVKSYPTSTHAHTAEYRLESLDQLNKLYDSVDQSWRRSRTETFRTADKENDE